LARYLNYESGLLALVVLLGVFGLCLGMHLETTKALGLALGITLLAFFPLATMLQDYLIEYYAENGKVDRALGMAITVRDAAPNTRFRNRALVDVALIHLLRRDYANALANLEKVKLALVTHKEARAVVEGHLAYCMAHEGKADDRAEELALAAVAAVPGEPLFGYYQGLVLLKRGKAAEAEALIQKSLEVNPDEKVPFAGERTFMLAQAQKDQGKPFDAAKARAVAAGGAFAELAKAL
jgi:tetratricopeptide (TPR) repeat protein